MEFNLSTVTGSQTDLVLHPGMECDKSNTNINATSVCFSALDYPGLSVNLVIKSKKMSPTANGYQGNAEY